MQSESPGASKTTPPREVICAFIPVSYTHLSPRTVDIDYPMADGIFNQGGSFLQMRRFKPKDSDFENNFNLKFFTDNNIKLLVTEYWL